MKKYFIVFIVFCNLLYGQDYNISDILQNSFIYSSGNEPSVVFRKAFKIPNDIKKAEINIFADSYYSLFINGEYVLNGPGRFDPSAPEYDTKDIIQFLRRGENLIAVLVYSGISNGMRMKHEPGLTLSLKGNEFNLTTNPSWKCSEQTRFKSPYSLWNGIKETIDASSEKGDCSGSAYDDSKWGHAVPVNGNLWGKLKRRILPLLAERKIEPLSGPSLPSVNDTFKISFDKNYLLAVEMKVKAEAGINIKINEFGYTTKSGIQNFRTFDSFGITDARLMITSTGKIELLDISLYNRVYPFELSGEFECSDPALTRLWQISAHTLRQCTEDGYQDCPWERAEWMGDAAVIEYPLTRVAFTSENGFLSDPRLIKKMINDIALSQDSTGRLKAHHPSDRFDIHAYIEDYSCLWVQALRDYFEYTGDINFVREIFPVMEKLLAWFLDQMTDIGLIKGREFVIVDNPICYKTCIGTTLNAFIYKALMDGSFLSSVLQNQEAEEYYKKSAFDLKVAFNNNLWNDMEKTYNASTEDKPSYHSALMPLDRGIVPEERIPFVKKWLLQRYIQASESFFTYTHFWFLKFLYNENTDSTDKKALEVIRTRYAATYSDKNIGFTSGENFQLERPFHNFGSSAGYFLSANVLGVTVKLPLSENVVIIKPRLGDLSYASGKVVTEHGVVPVSWKKEPNILIFSMTIPRTKKAILKLPLLSPKQSLKINGKNRPYSRDGNFSVVELSEGQYSGTIATGPDLK